MTLDRIDSVTGEVLAELTRDAAHRLTERIRLTAMNARDAITKLHGLVAEAREGGADRVLGYPSWTAYLAACFGDQPLRLPREERMEVVQMLAAEGMSTRAIGAVVGTHHDTVASDLRRVGNPTPGLAVRSRTPDAANQVERFTGYSQLSVVGEAVTPTTDPTTARQESPAPRSAVDVAENGVRNHAAAPLAVVGLDGKTYTRPELKAPVRRPLRDGFRDASLDLGKIVRRFESLVADDRFTRNKNEVARYANDLARARDALQRVIETFN